MTPTLEPRDDSDVTDALREGLRDRYTVGATLGRGGMSIVYRAHDLRYDRDVAVKVLRAELSGALGAERFLREIRTVARLQHPHILPVFDSGEVGGLLYYVMPCVDGQSLRERMAGERQLSIAESLRIAREVGSALDYAHSQGLVHRDIKPANILLSSGIAIVSDFGIARAISEAGGERLTGQGVVIGTPAYMSPEQAVGEHQVDGRSDIYSLGCVLFEMLAGEPPFSGTTRQAVLARHRQEPPPTIHVVRSTVPPLLESVVEQALAKLPADRFRSAAQFVAALDTVATSEMPPVGPTPPRLRRRRIAAGVIVAVAAASLGLLWPDGRPADRNKVVMFPLAQPGLPRADSGAGYSAALAISGAFEYAHPLKWIDGWRDLDERQRMDPVLVTTAAARRIARYHGARHFIDGAIHRQADTLVLTLMLHDAAGDSLIVQRSGRAPIGEYALHDAAFDAIRQLLPSLLDAGRRIDLTPLTKRHPAAIALWIEGEREYRRARFGSALDLYRRAVEQDSLMAFAAIKGAQAASWSSRSQEAARLNDLALAHVELLPAQHASFARGFQAYLNGRADTALALLERARGEAPARAEIPMALAEVYYHLLPRRAPLDSLAEAAFSEAWELDSAFTPPLVHLAEIAIRRGAVDRAQALIERLRKESPDSAVERPLEIALECVRGGARRMDWNDAVEREFVAAFGAAKILSGGASQAACAEGAFRAVLRAPPVGHYSYAAMSGLQGLLVAHGRHAEAMSLVDSAAARHPPSQLLHIVDLAAGAPSERRAADVDAFVRRTFGDDYARVGPQVQWLIAIWHASRRDTAKVRMLQQAVATRAAQRGEPRARVLAEALAAHLSLVEGDSAGALGRLRALSPALAHDSLTWGFDALPAERLLLARLLLANGEHAEAYAVAAAFDQPGPLVYIPFLPASLAIRHYAATAMGNDVEAAAARGRLDALGRTDLLDTTHPQSARR